MKKHRKSHPDKKLIDEFARRIFQNHPDLIGLVITGIESKRSRPHKSKITSGVYISK